MHTPKQGDPNHPIFLRLADSSFYVNNYEDHQRRIKLFKSNCIYILNSERVPVKTFFEKLNLIGCKIRRESFLTGTNRATPSSIIITTFANLLDVEPGILFSEDIVRDYIPLRDRQTAPK